MAEQVQLKKARLVDMILYGFGGIGANIPFIFMGAYLSFFYTDIFGLAPAIVSALMLGSKIVDAVIDPFIGALADRVVTKFGKFRPFVMFGAPPQGQARDGRTRRAACLDASREPRRIGCRAAPPRRRGETPCSSRDSSREASRRTGARCRRAQGQTP